MPTLYINDQEVEARLDDRRVSLERFDYKKDDVQAMTVPLFDVDRVVMIGYPKLSMQLVHHFIYNNIPVVFLSRHGRWVTSMYPKMNGNVMRRMRQYSLAQEKKGALQVSKALIYAKVRNERRVLQRLAANRELSGEPEQMNACNSLNHIANTVRNVNDIEELRGYEGMAAQVYFSRLGKFFSKDFPFVSRNRRPPKDPANALLSWSYSIVMAEIEAAIMTAGLDTCLGFLHEISYGRPSLACDLIEPLRAPLCDLLAINIVNHGILKQTDFEQNKDDGGFYMKKDSRRNFFGAYEQYMGRSFKMYNSPQHTNFRRVIVQMVNTIANFIDDRVEPEFFLMP